MNEEKSDATLYELLGVQKNSSIQEIRREYQRLVLKYHPDKQTGSEPAAKTRKSSPNGEDMRGRTAAMIFQDIHRAWGILRDSESRELYDKELALQEQKNEVMISDAVSLDDMLYSVKDRTFSWLCRCGGSFIMHESDVESGYNVIQCESCSLHIKVLYAKED